MIIQYNEQKYEVIKHSTGKLYIYEFKHSKDKTNLEYDQMNLYQEILIYMENEGMK